MRYVNRHLNLPDDHFFLLGPRGTGKSTVLKKRYPDALVIDLLLPDYFRSLSARPERLVELVDGNPKKRTVIIDEIQKVPDLLAVIHNLIERNDGRQYVMTGSSARKLRQQGVNLLGGRAVRRSMHPFTAAELGDRFDLADSLKHGLIPVIVQSADPLDALRAYVDLYVREEVMMEGLTRNAGNFSRFLEAISFSHGSVLNISSVARDCEIERKVVESYIGILEDLMIARRVPTFTRRARRQLTQHPKFYFFDTGIYRGLRPAGPLDTPEEISGAALEGLILQHLMAWRDNRNLSVDVSFWRTRSGTEVDFVLYGTSVFAAIEVKHSDRVRPRDLTSLKSFQTDYPGSNTILLYRGKDRYLSDNVLVLPCADFLMSMDEFLK